MATTRYNKIKRILDLICVIATAPLWIPLSLIISLIVLLSMGHPVIFRQKRAGYKGRIFTIYKFRTMRHGDGNDKERLTKTGAILRSTSLDELPQLINVLKGEMSLVGPRPLLEEYLPHYTKEESRRHDVRPGITGWAQVNGRNAISWEKKFQYDIWYADHQSLPLDIKILCLTILRVLKRDNILTADNEIMAPFHHRRN